jgi:hypothetical protein
MRRAYFRPAFGRRPWFAFLRRGLSLRFFVFFDTWAPVRSVRTPQANDSGPKGSDDRTGFTETK